MLLSNLCTHSNVRLREAAAVIARSCHCEERPLRRGNLYDVAIQVLVIARSRHCEERPLRRGNLYDVAIQVFLLPLKPGLPRRIKRSSQRRAPRLREAAKRLAVAICLLAFSICAFANITTDPYPFTSKTDATRFTSLTSQIRCVVCQHQNIAESSAPLAEGMRRKVYQMILDKKSDGEIKDFLVKRYGEFILLNPRFNTRTVLLWLIPFLGLGLGGIVLFRVFRPGLTDRRINVLKK